MQLTTQKSMRLFLNGRLLVSILVIIFMSCQPDIKEDVSLNNKSYDQIITKKGKPASETRLLLERNIQLYEYQSSLYDLLNNNDTIEVKEVKWIEKDMETAIWFVKKDEDWISVDNIAWNNKKVKF